MEEFGQDEATLIARTKQVLDDSVVGLDQVTVLRLQRARMAALSARPVLKRRWIGVGGLAMASVAALVILLWTKQPAPERQHIPPLEDMELMMSAENVELAQDLEFYDWLADVDQTG